MAFIPAEVYINDDSTIIVVRNKNGSYSYFIEAGTTINGVKIMDIPVVAREIAEAMVEVMEFKVAKK